jgi:hypothetical protein
LAFTAYDRRWLSWEERVPATRAPQQAFDRAAALAAWSALNGRRRWTSPFPPGGRTMSRDEAVFWLYGLSTRSPVTMFTLDVTRSPSTAEAFELVRYGAGYGDVVDPRFIALGNLFDGPEVLEIVLHTDLPSPTPDYLGYRPRARLAAGFCDYVAPFLPPGEFEACRERMRQKFPSAAWGTESAAHVHLAAALHLPELVTEFAGRIPDGGRDERDRLHDAHHVLYGLGERERIVAAMNRVQPPLRSAQDVREWLAITGADGLAYAFAHVAEGELDARECVDALGTMECAATVTAMLRPIERRSLAVAAKAWLDRHPTAAIPVALASLGRRRLADNAADTLRRAAAHGHAGTIEAASTRDACELVLGTRSPSESAADALAWLDAPAWREPAAIPWLQTAALPALVAGGRELGERHVAPIVRALRAGTLHAPDARIRALRRYALAESAERFALALFAQWRAVNAPLCDLWALHAMGLFGADEAAVALASFVGNYRAERAEVAVECLRAIGSDVAVMLVEAFSRDLPFWAGRAHAAECLEELAAQRNLSRDELEDRAVPVRDVAGVDVAQLLDRRFETAMVEQRRWRGDAFATLLVAHPVTGPLVRRLLWLLESADDGAPRPFRVLADGMAARIDGDAAVAIPANASVRIAHRVELDERTVDAWEARLAAAQIVAPFAQTGRVGYRLDDVELANRSIDRFDRSRVPEKPFMRGLRVRGWLPQEPHGQAYQHHRKRFERPGLTAELAHDPVFVYERRPNVRIAFRGCTFVRSSNGEPVSLRDVPAVTISEVCADCTFVLGLA